VTGRLDVHAHFVPPGYREVLERSGHAQPDGMPVVPSGPPRRTSR
jgi:hypothetical protein